MLFGLYLGQRLGDLARLTWRAVNLENRRDCVHRSQDRTANRVAAGATAQSITWHHCQRATIRTLSSFRTAASAQAHRLHCPISSAKFSLTAGLVEPREYEATGKQPAKRRHARETSEISFHSLRHSAVTMLKASGLSDFIAREIVGHESAAVSRQYTHLTTDDLRNAMQRLPDVTSG